MTSSKPKLGKSLAETHPELAAQADGWDLTTVTAGSGKQVFWKCEFGHRWEAKVYSRSAGKGCPVCSGRAVLPGSNDLASTNPDLASQADGWDPTTVTASSNEKVFWICEFGHRWEATATF